MSAKFTGQGHAQDIESAIPAEMRRVRQWVAWWSVMGEGEPAKLPSGGFTKVLKQQQKFHKLPIDPGTGGLAASTRPTTWSSFEAATATAQKYSLTGVGFVFADSDPYSGVDLDNCREPGTGQISGWARDIIRALDSYTEVSPSGTGVHIIVRGALPLGKGNQATHAGGKVEMFSRARYFTFTGERVDGTPAEVCERSTELLSLHANIFSHRSENAGGRQQAATLDSDPELIRKARGARNGSKFDRLWSGQWQGGDYASHSEADLALCCILAFWTRNDAGRIDSLFRQSSLMRDDRWNCQSYRERTIQAAVAHSSETRRPGRRSSYKQHASSRQGGTRAVVDQDIPNLLHFPHTDSGNGERLLRLYGSDLRFCSEMKKWLVWDGRRWTSEDTRTVKRLCKKTMRELYRQAADIPGQDERKTAEAHARKSESAVSIKNALSCAEFEEGVCISAGSLDRHPYLLNCLNGKLDLCTGKLRPHDRQDLFTKLVHVNYRSDATCPQFLRFLRRIMGGNADSAANVTSENLVAYLQRGFGYSLTADVAEKAVFCFFGSGNNGKTTLLEIIRFILFEYSAQLLIDTLMAHRSRESSSSMADVADLRGARFVTTSEAEEGQQLAVSKVKYLTQGMGELKTCRKYENPITFTATHKLFLDANYKPIVRGTEKALWNRLKPIPFTVTIPPAEIDKHLLENLKGEAEGILAWMVEGCLLWRQNGLGEPPEIGEALASWQAESDHFPTFVDKHYVRQTDGYVAATDPWVAYAIWCESNREESRLTKTQFDTRLAALGLRQGRRNDGRLRVWIGIRARDVDDECDSPSDKVTGSDMKC